MRPLAFILGLLVLTLNWVPCGDHSAFTGGDSQRQTVYAASDRDAPCNDVCSPFCTCSCCASVSILFSMPQVASTLPVVSSKKVPAYNAPAYSATLSSIWQPPRM